MKKEERSGAGREAEWEERWSGKNKVEQKMRVNRAKIRWKK